MIKQAVDIVEKFPSGSSLPVRVKLDNQTEVVLKWTGCGEGAVNNIVEVVGLKLAQKLGLPVPAVYFVEVKKSLLTVTKDPELKDIIRNSLGINLGIEYLEKTITAYPDKLPIINSHLQTKLFAFDLLFLNFDRYRLNTNILFNQKQVYFIDFAALLELMKIVRGVDIPDFYAVERLRYHPFYCSNLDTDLLGAVSSAQISQIINEIPDSWLNRYQLQASKVRNELGSRIKELFKEQTTIIGDRLDKVNQVNYRERTEVRREQRKRSKEFQARIAGNDS